MKEVFLALGAEILRLVVFLNSWGISFHSLRLVSQKALCHPQANFALDSSLVDRAADLLTTVFIPKVQMLIYVGSRPLSTLKIRTETLKFT